MNNQNTFYTDIPPRRNSYQMAIYTSKLAQYPCFSSSSSSSSSCLSCLEQSNYTIHNHCAYCMNDADFVQRRSVSQPLIRLPDNDILLENATDLFDSPVHALRPTYQKSRGTLSPTRSASIINENIDSTMSSNISTNSIYRIVFLRSLASVFALASLFTIEVLQTSLYSIEQSFQSILTLNLSSSLAAFIFSIHSSHVQTTRHHWKISNILAYDRCSQILIIFSTLFISFWICMQYFHWFSYLVLLTASISGMSLSCMIVKTFDHLLQLSTNLPIENLQILTIRFNIFAFIYNTICQLALSIGGACLLMIVWYQQWKTKAILIGYQSCSLIPCLEINNPQQYTHQLVPINLTIYLTDTKQIWINDSNRYQLLLSLVVLTLVSLLLQASTEWSTSILSMSRRLSLLHYTLNNIPTGIYYRHYLFALFIGFQEGYLFGNVLKFDVTCLYGLQHAIEILIISGLSSTLASGLLALIIKNFSLQTTITLTTILHSITLIFFYLIRTSHIPFHHFDPLINRYILFACYGFVLGLWSTIAIDSICNSTKLSSSSIFAQSLSLRYLGRIGAYTCTLFVCQSYFVYLNSICLLSLFIFTCIFYHCCHE